MPSLLSNVIIRKSPSCPFPLREGVGGRLLLALLLLFAGNFGAARAQGTPPGTAPSATTITPAQRQAWQTLLDTADEADNKGSYDIAIKNYQQVLDQARAAGSESAIAYCQEKLGTSDYEIAYHGLCPDNEVLAYLRKGQNALGEALTLFEKLHSTERCAKCLFDQGLICYQTARSGGDVANYDQSIEDIKQAMQVYQSLHDDDEIAACFKELGIVYTEMERWDEALDAFDQSDDVMGKKNGRDSAAYKWNLSATTGGRAQIYETLGRDDDALTEISRTLALYRQLVNPRGVAYCFNELGLIEQDYGTQNCDEIALRKAIDDEGQALALYTHLHLDADRASCLNNQMNDYRVLGIIDADEGRAAKAKADFASAISVIDQANKPYESLQDTSKVQFFDANLAGVLCSEGRYAKARDLLSKSVEYFGTRNLLIQAQCLANLGIADNKLGRWNDARSDYVEAVKRFEDLSASIDDSNAVSSFDETDEGAVYADYADVLLNLKQPLDALSMADRGRAQGLSRQIAGSHVDFDKLLTPDDAKQLEAKRKALNEAGIALRAAQDTGKDVSAAQSTYDDADHELTLFRDSLLAQDKYAAYRQAKGRAAPTGAQLTALAAAHPDTLYLEWADVDDKTMLLFALSRKDGLKAFRLAILAPRVNGLVRDWKRAIKAGVDADEQKAARQLYQLLLGPADTAGLLAPGRYRHLVLIPDPGFADLPMAALIDSHNRRLIERFPLSTDIALGMLLWPADRPQPAAPLFCAADTGADKPERFGSNRVALSPPMRLAANAPVRGKDFRSGLGALPSARKEGRRVVSLFPGSLGLAGPAAREADVKAAMPRYALLHFATHGVLDPQNGLRSWLMLAPEPAGSPEDGRLEAREVAQMHLSAQMATLSSCDSGLGQQGGGDGLLGLAWGFQAAGCPSVICSLWSVDDAATSQLMDAFYTNLKTGEPKDVALQQAMLRLLKQGGPDRVSPYWWAAFQAVGDTSPLHLPKIAAAR